MLPRARLLNEYLLRIDLINKLRATWEPWQRSPMHTISLVGGPNSEFSSSATPPPGPRWFRFTVGVASARQSCYCASPPVNPPFYSSRATSYVHRRSQTFCARPPNGSLLLISPSPRPPRG